MLGPKPVCCSFRLVILSHEIQYVSATVNGYLLGYDHQPNKRTCSRRCIIEAEAVWCTHS